MNDTRSGVVDGTMITDISLRKAIERSFNGDLEDVLFRSFCSFHD